MKKLFTLLLSLCAFSASASVEERMLQDFESYQVGEAVDMWNIYNSDISTSSAIVAADPKDASNKVLHIKSRSWNTLVALHDLGITAADLTGEGRFLVFDLYRPSSDGAYKQLMIYCGDKRVYIDGSFVSQCPPERWTTKCYQFDASTDESGTLCLGFNSTDAEYYIDNVRIVDVADFGYDRSDAENSIRHYAEQCGKNIGIAVATGDANFFSAMNDDSKVITQTVSSQFNMIVAGNEMKFDAMEPEQGNFKFETADKLVAFAEQHQMKVRGHTLVWHSQLPGWLGAGSEGASNNNNYTRDELLKIMENHITTIVSHYKGRVHEWDVVNECVSDNSTQTLRNSIWQKVIGESFIDSAFVYARRADPDAKLYINDYSVEFAGNNKADRYYNLVKKLVARGVPIDGVGLQAHLYQGAVDSAKLDRNMKRYAELGLNCIITELDISLPTSQFGSQTAYEKQAADYRKIVNVTLNNANSPSLLIWGSSDAYSWIPGSTNYTRGEPLLFDTYFCAKPAYYAVRDAYSARATTMALEEVLNAVPSESLYVDVYNILGQPVRLHMHRSQIYSLPQGTYIIDGKVMNIR